MPSRIERWYLHRGKFSLINRFILSLTINRVYEIRNDFASKYIIGKGFEIGAQNAPVKCKNASKIEYIDYLSRIESSRKYNIDEDECVEVDIIADANNLTAIPSNSASFLIANHVLEHSPNPIGALLGWLSILHVDGTLFISLPNHKSNEFDFEKKITDPAHFIEDYERDQENKDIITEHIYEHIQLIEGIAPENKSSFEKRYKDIVQSKLHTHYHVFNKKNILSLLNFVHKKIPIRIVNCLYFDTGIELLFIIKKIPRANNNLVKIEKNHLFNYTIFCKHFIVFLLKTILKKRKNR